MKEIAILEFLAEKCLTCGNCHINILLEFEKI